MVLTEPDAGSDVGAGHTKATLQEDGSWHMLPLLSAVRVTVENVDNDIMELDEAAF